MTDFEDTALQEVLRNSLSYWQLRQVDEVAKEIQAKLEKQYFLEPGTGPQVPIRIQIDPTVPVGSAFIQSGLGPDGTPTAIARIHGLQKDSYTAGEIDASYTYTPATGALAGPEMFPPECERHGQMLSDFIRMRWYCPAEECWSAITHEEFHRMDFRRYVVICR